ncbi:MAG: hypothetical protein ACK5L3_03720, partial [Oscillospiraceae bacterium]
MKRMRIIAAATLAALLLAVWPVAALAASVTTPGGSEEWIIGDASIAPGETKNYYLFENGGNVSDGFVFWEIISPVSAGTSISASGVGTLTVASNETAASITIQSTDTFWTNHGYSQNAVCTFTITVSSSPAPGGETPGEGSTPAPAGGECNFWLGVHAQLKAQVNKAKLTVTAEGESFVPYYIVNLMVGSRRTLTIQTGLDTIVLTGALASKTM